MIWGQISLKFKEKCLSKTARSGRLHKLYCKIALTLNLPATPHISPSIANPYNSYLGRDELVTTNLLEHVWRLFSDLLSTLLSNNHDDVDIGHDRTEQTLCWKQQRRIYDTNHEDERCRISRNVLPLYLAKICKLLLVTFLWDHSGIKWFGWGLFTRFEGWSPESVKILTRDAEFNISLVDDSIDKILIL